MKKIITPKDFQLFLFFILLRFTMTAQDPNFHIYLCFGQSNMEGSAAIEEQDKTVDKRFFKLQPTDCTTTNLTKGNWYTAIPPISQCWAKLSPADYFGRTLVEKLPDSIKVGVLNVAVGGCDIRLFDKNKYENYLNTYPEKWFQDKIVAYGGNPYKRFINLAKLAKKEGIIKGILLHQGESNTGDENWPEYVAEVYKNILADLELEANSVPILAGEVVHAEQHGKCASMNNIINKLPNIIETAHIISSKGCAVQSDSVHFNSKGVRELGKRYAEKMLLLKN